MSIYNITIINGPNLNLLGSREPHIYGDISLDKIISQLQHKQSTKINHYQNNHEGNIVDYIQNMENCDFLIINLGALTHTSISIRDVILAKNIPFYELHISNVFKREKFRHQSFYCDIAEGIITGFGTYGYQLAIQGAENYLSEKQGNKDIR